MPIDYKKYPANWLTEIRPRIMKRADNKCEKCGVEHLSIIYSIKLAVRTLSGQYKKRSIWFKDKLDALREDEFKTIKEVKVVLTIAHLDHDANNHEVEDDRLRAYCQSCHLRYDAKEKYKRRLNKLK